MDLLSDVITTVRVGRPKSTLTRRAGSWAERFGPYPGAGFHVVLEGRCWLTPAHGAPVGLSAGDVVLLAQGAEHAVGDRPVAAPGGLPWASVAVAPEPGEPDPPGPSDVVVLLCGAYRLDRGHAHPLLGALPPVVHLPASVGRHPALRGAVELLGQEARRERPGADAALPALLDLLLVCILRAWLDEAPDATGAPGWSAALHDPAVAAALHRMHREPARAWTVQTLAEAVGLSRTVFARRFTELVGRPPLAYLTWWRLTTGARLLRGGDATIAAVARQVGYTSEPAFAHAFKREFGTAAGRYRRAAPEDATS